MSNPQPIKSIDEFNEEVHIGDYNRFDVNDCASVLGIEGLLSSDKTINQFVEETGIPYHFMVKLRQREIALDVLLPLIEQTQPITEKEWSDDRTRSQAPCHRINDLVLLGMYAAIGLGWKIWPIDYKEIRAMTGQERVKVIKNYFEKDKLKLTTLHEAQTGNLTFETYTTNKGELNKDEYLVVRSYAPLEQDYVLARESLEKVKELGHEKIIKEHDVDIVAKLIGALGNRVPREAGSDKPHCMWLLTESKIIQGECHSYGVPGIQR